MSSSAGCSSLALHTDNQKESSDDRPPCLENPRPAGAESTLTENVASPFQAEPTHASYFGGTEDDVRSRVYVLSRSGSRQISTRSLRVKRSSPSSQLALPRFAF